MIANKTLVYKPHLDRRVNQVSSSQKKNVAKFCFKEWIKQLTFNTALILTTVLLFVMSVATAYKTYVWIKLKVEKHQLLSKNKELKNQFYSLTSREIVLEKAKKLGLRPPQNGDYIFLR
ncbi:hypothetical protein [Thermodesulfobacterium thermophilum]|uniref:hypothetical protein n=1 Tax=Thermodesulfobacterium thermophilum TaxID=886 RepID=UPI0003B6C740|nr:hypothetical protein [Thermodesulfobacterium thermophilum]